MTNRRIANGYHSFLWVDIVRYMHVPETRDLCENARRCTVCIRVFTLRSTTYLGSVFLHI